MVSASYFFGQYEFLLSKDIVLRFLWYTLYYAIPYILIAGAVSVFVSRSLRHRRIQETPLRRGQILREILLSFLTIAVFGVVAIYMFAQSRIRGESVVYSDVSERGWLYFIGSLVVMIVLHDAYFYWTHRLMHLPRLFPALHRAHHRSRTPTAFAAYAFSPAEAVLHALYIPLFTAFLPVHWLVFTLFVLHMIARNVQIHCGVETMPLGAIDHPILGCFTTVTHHDLHHSRGSSDYGLYFTWWDRMMGTENSDYVKEFRRHAAAPITPSSAQAETGASAARAPRGTVRSASL